MTSGSKIATLGMIAASAMVSFRCFSGNEMTAASVVSDPVPAVVGTAIRGG